MTVYNPQYAHVYEAKGREIPSFGIWMKLLLENIDFELENTMKETTSAISPWTHVPPKINFDSKKKKNPKQQKMYFEVILMKLEMNFQTITAFTRTAQR